MLVDRHHVQYLIDLGQVAQGKSARQLAPLEDRLETFLGTLAGAASPAARRAFQALMQRLPQDDGPWAAVRPVGSTHRPAGAAAAGGPPAAELVLGQIDDDPDGEEDGNRLPDAGLAAA